MVTNAKANGYVGEMSDGYLGFPTASVPADVRKHVQSINIKRRSAYAKLAREKGVTVDIAAALTAEKLIRRARRGEYVRLPSGEWKKVN